MSAVTARTIAKLGNHTTKGHIISASATVFDGNDPLVRGGDKAWCDTCKGAFQINATYTGFIEDGFFVGDGDQVLCGCDDNYVIASSGYTGERHPGFAAARSAQPAQSGLSSFSSSPEPVAPVVPVFSKSCLRGTGCTDAGTAEEPQENFATMSFYQSQPAAPASSSTPATDSGTVQHAQTAKKKKPAGEKAETATPEKKRSLFDKVTGFFFGEAEAMPLPPPPVVLGGGAEAGMAASAGGAMAKLNQDAAQALSHRMKRLSGPEVWQGEIAMNLPFVVMGAVLQSMLKGEKSDLLTADKLLEVAGRKGTVPTRVRYRWETDAETGRLKAVGYHTGPDSGRDQVRVRLLEKNINGGYGFWEDGELQKPLITWSPADAPGSSDTGGWHTGNNTPAGTVTIPGLEHPDTHDIRVTTTPAPEEKDFRDYILVFPGNVHPPIYVYLSKPPAEMLEVAPYRDFNGRSRQGLYHVDHMPSRQAVILYLEREHPDLTEKDIKIMADQVAAIVIPKEIHQEDSMTYGGRNHTQKEPDSRSLREAADRNFDAVESALMDKRGMTKAELESKRTEMHKINTELGLYK